MTSTTKIENESKIVLNPKGNAKKEMPLSHVGVPDLWNIAAGMPDLARIAWVLREVGGVIDHVYLGDTQVGSNDVEDAVSQARMYGPFINTKGEKTQEKILEVWHLAIDLLNHLRAVTETAQPILDLLSRVESGDTKGAGGSFYASDKPLKERLNAVTVPVELLRALRVVHMGGSYAEGQDLIAC